MVRESDTEPRSSRFRSGRIVESSFIQKNYNGGGAAAEETAGEVAPD